MTVEKAVLATIVVGVINADVTSNAVPGVDQVDTTCVVPVGYGYGSGRAGRRHLPLEDGAQHEVRHDAREDRLGGLDRLRK